MPRALLLVLNLAAALIHKMQYLAQLIEEPRQRDLQFESLKFKFRLNFVIYSFILLFHAGSQSLR